MASVVWDNVTNGASGGTCGCAGTPSCAWTSTAIALDLGDNTVKVTATDAAGNTGTDSVTVTRIVLDTPPPARSDGQPSGPLPSGTTDTTLSLVTDEVASCGYATVPGTAFADMTPFAATGAAAHQTPIGGLADGQSYGFFVRCGDAAGNVNTDDFAITFDDVMDLSLCGVAFLWESNPASEPHEKVRGGKDP